MNKKLLPLIFIVGFIALFSFAVAQDIDESYGVVPFPDEYYQIKAQLENSVLTPEDIGDWGGPPNANTGTSCFDYYKFQSVQVGIDTDKRIYLPGDVVNLIGDLVNENSYPVVDGYVFARIGRVNPNYITEGNYLVDEMFIAEGVAIDANAEKEIKFQWVVPDFVIGGEYRIDYFFSVGKKFNLAGLAFSNEVIAGNTFFEIESSNDGIYFDQSKTKVNGEWYFHMGGWPTVDSDSEISITQPIVNNSNINKTINIRYDLYWWDGIDENNKISSKSESVDVSANSSKTLFYKIIEIKEPVYYLKITAESGGQKSITNIRVISNLERPRLNYPAITKFPLRKGDEFTMFTCFHNSSGANTDGRVVLNLFDKRGEKIDSLEYQGQISSSMDVAKKDLVSGKDYDYLNISASVFNKNGEMVDEYSVVYDCEKINPEKCKPTTNTLYVSAAIIITLIIIIMIYRMRNKISINANKINIFLLLFFFISLLFLAPAEDAQAKSVNASSNYCLGGNSGWRYTTRLLSTGNVTVTHNVSMSPFVTEIMMGGSVQFNYSRGGSFNAYGGAWDTPPFGAWQAIGGGNRGGGITWSFAGGTSVSMSSNNNSILSCSGMGCTAVGPGTARVTANINTTPARIGAYIYTNSGLYGISPQTRDIGPHLRSNSSCYCESGTDWRGNNTCPYQYTTGTTINLPSKTMSWNITVLDPTPSCDLKVKNVNDSDYSDGSIEINAGDSIDIEWTSEDAETCSATSEGGDGVWTGIKSISGNEIRDEIDSATTYKMKCAWTSNVSDPIWSEWCSVDVNVGGAPTAWITADGESGSVSVPSGGIATIEWGSDDAIYCTPTSADMIDRTTDEGFVDGDGNIPESCNISDTPSCSLSSHNINDTQTYSVKCFNSNDIGSNVADVIVDEERHTDCVGGACQLISGPGSNGCESNLKCGDGGGNGGGGSQWHSICAQNACVIVDGSGDNQCVSDTECGGAPPSEYYGLCAQNACVRIAGQAPAGADQCYNYGGSCGTGTPDSFTLELSNSLSINIVGDTGVFCSDYTNITINNLGTNFNAAVHLSVSDWGGFDPYSHTFTLNPIQSPQYDSGSNFRVCVDASHPAGSYNLTIDGDGAGIVRSVTPPITLTILKKDPDWKETRFWKDLFAGIFQ